MDLSGQLHTLVNLPLGKARPYPLNRRLGGPQSLPECSESLQTAKACNGKELHNRHFV
jgi:hypothetical protein